MIVLISNTVPSQSRDIKVSHGVCNLLNALMLCQLIHCISFIVQLII